MKPALLLICGGAHTTTYDSPPIRAHYRVLQAADGVSARALMVREHPVIVLLCIHEADPEAVVLCQHLAAFDIPILALIEARDPTLLLERLVPGIADYLIHPAHSTDLLDRIRVVRSRQEAQPAQVLHQVSCGALRIDLDARQIWRDADAIHLTRIEWTILEALVRAAGRLLRHEALCAQIGTNQDVLTPESLRGHIGRIRKKLGDNPENPQYIFLERGQGYRFAPVTPITSPVPEPRAVSLLALPATRNAFIGRQDEIQQLLTWLRDPELRLFTLTGSAGVGKTRLALKVAELAAPLFPAGIVFVALDTIRDPELVPQALAKQLGLKEVERLSLTETIIAALQGRTILLLFDNLEHLPGTVPFIQRLLDEVRELKVLATSRVPLQLYGEHRLIVNPFPLPEHTDTGDYETIRAAAAVQLFVRRAREIRTHFELSAQNAAVIAEICRRLEGLPLSIELAAAQIASMQLKTLLVKLNRPFAVLYHDLRDRTVRQTTLQGAIAWSIDLLQPHEQQLFFELGVFVGGWTAEAAALVCTASSPEAVETVLAVLVQHSLIQRSDVAEDAVRFAMLEVIREYAHEELLRRDPSSVTALQRRHAHAIQRLVQEAVPLLSGPDQIVWLDRLEHEVANIRAALDWSFAHEGERAAQLAGALMQFWLTRGYLSEGRQWLSRIAHDQRFLSDVARGRAFNAAGVMAQWQGDHIEARVLLTEALKIRQQLGDSGPVADTRTNLAFVAQDLAEYAAAQEHLESCLVIFQQRGDAPAIADTLNNLGNLWDSRGEYQRAQPLLEQALTLFEAQQDIRSVAMVLGNLGQVARNLGDLQKATALLTHCLRLRHQVGDKAEIANAQLGLGIVATLQGDTARARPFLRDSLDGYQTIGMRRQLLECLEATALWLAACGETAMAARILATATTIRDQEGKRRNVTDTRRYQQLQHMLEEQLGADLGAQIAQLSSITTLEQTIALAYARLEPPGSC